MARQTVWVHTPSVMVAALRKGPRGEGTEGESRGRKGGEKRGCVRVIAGEFANAAWRTEPTRNKVGHPESPSPGFHSSVTVERGPNELTGLILSRLSAWQKGKPNTTFLSGFSKSGNYRTDTVVASKVYVY